MEPQAEPFRKLQGRYGNRERLVLLRAAVDQRSGTRALYRCRDGLVVGDAAAVLSGFASFDRSQVVKSYLRYARRLGLDCPPDDAIVADEVTTFTLDSVLRRQGYERFDLLMLDTEGYDFEIIKGIDFSRVRPTVLIYEHSNLCRADRLACWQLLHASGYRCAAGWTDTIGLLADRTLSAASATNRAARRSSSGAQSGSPVSIGARRAGPRASLSHQPAAQ